jgi:hypothetical protein
MRKMLMIYIDAIGVVGAVVTQVWAVDSITTTIQPYPQAQFEQDPILARRSSSDTTLYNGPFEYRTCECRIAL